MISFAHQSERTYGIVEISSRYWFYRKDLRLLSKTISELDLIVRELSSLIQCAGGAPLIAHGTVIGRMLKPCDVVGRTGTLARQRIRVSSTQSWKAQAPTMRPTAELASCFEL